MAKRDKEATPPPVPELPATPPTVPIPAALEPPPPPEPGAEPVKRRRKRTPKEPPPTPPVAGAGPEDIARCELAIKTSFAIGSKMTAKKYNVAELTDEEATTLGQVWTAALEPYLPKIGAAVPWATAVVITWAIAKPRFDSYQAQKAAANPETPVPTGPRAVE